VRMLRIRHDAIVRGRRVVLEAGGFEMPLPASVAVVGINGSGKSSLFMHVTNTLRQRTSHPVGACAFAPQVPALPGWLRAEDVARLYNTTFAQLMHDMPALHLDELRGRRVASLSLGQQQALAIALAIQQPASMMILDEPFSALDFRRRLGALQLLHEWKNARPDRALLLSSQNAADLIDVCDYFAVIRDGRYVFTGPRTALADTGDAQPTLQQTETSLLSMLS